MVSGKSNKPDTKVSSAKLKRKEAYHDSPGMPIREIDKHEEYRGKKYVELKPEHWKKIQEHTASFPEFLEVSVLLKNLSIKDFCDVYEEETAEELPRSSLRGFVRGHSRDSTSFPDQEKAENLMKLCFPDDEEMRNHGIDLIKKNLAQTALGAYERGNYKAVAKREQRLFDDYFVEKVQCLVQGDAYARKVHPPEWMEGVENIVTIERNYQYLGSLRRALGLDSSVVAAEVGCSDKTVLDAEQYSADSRQASRERLFNHYETVAQQRGMGWLANPEVFKSLGAKPLKGHIEREAQKREQAANSDKGPTPG